MHRLDKLRRPGIVSQHPPNPSDTPFQHPVADEGLRPDGREEFFVGHQALGMRYQEVQNCKVLWPERKRLRPLPEAGIERVEGKGSEVNYMGRRHWPFSVSVARWLPSLKLHHIFTVSSGLSMSP